jgi:acyl-CoA synthetase (AMP-forming)/AMP-acid ligase II
VPFSKAKKNEVRAKNEHFTCQHIKWNHNPIKYCKYISMKYQTISETIINLIKDAPDKGIGYVHANGHIDFVSYADTYTSAIRILGSLQANGLKPGDFVLIGLGKNEETIPVLWACFLGGFIPSIMQSLISYADIHIPEKKIGNIWNLLGRPLFIIPDHVEIDEYVDFRHFRYSELLHNNNKGILHRASKEDTAYIQFSSGSTGSPKGIMLSHENMLTNIHDIAVSNNINPKTIPVNWMPLYHDMGLVGFHLTPLYAQCRQNLIDVIDFVKNPILWLNIITELGVDVTAGPNFGQALILRHLKRKSNPDWNFSTITNFFNGAEPISADVMQRFIQAMSVYGFNETAMIPCYGMAEATLALSMRKSEVAPTIKSFDRHIFYHEMRAVETVSQAESVTLVGVGLPLGEVKIRIIDENGEELENTRIGNIRVSGRNVSMNYYNDGKFVNEIIDNNWLDTGDQGFFLGDELFITGRTKDLIILNGQNFYAHDLENAIVSVKNDLFGKTAISAVFDYTLGRDKLLLFMVGVINQKTRQEIDEVGDLLLHAYGLQFDEVILLKSAEFPRTSSGKLQRYKLIADYQKGIFEAVTIAARRQ